MVTKNTTVVKTSKAVTSGHTMFCDVNLNKTFSRFIEVDVTEKISIAKLPPIIKNRLIKTVKTGIHTSYSGATITIAKLLFKKHNIDVFNFVARDYISVCGYSPKTLETVKATYDLTLQLLPPEKAPKRELMRYYSDRSNPNVCGYATVLTHDQVAALTHDEYYGKYSDQIAAALNDIYNGVVFVNKLNVGAHNDE